MRLIFRVLSLVLLFPVLAHAQKRALTQADWDRWRSISGAALTNDGRWAVFTIAPLVGDGELIVRSTSSATEFRVPRGYLGRPNNTPGSLRPRNTNPEEEPAGPVIAPAQLTADSRHVVVLTYPPQTEFDAAARDRRRTATLQNRSDLAILRLADGNVTRVQRVRSVRVPRFSGEWIAYVVADSAAVDSSARPASGGGGSTRTVTRRRFGSTLVLRHMSSAREERIDDVLDFAFDDSAKVLGYTVVSRVEGRDGAYVRNLGAGRVTTLLAGRGDYDQIAFDRAASHVAFVSNREAFGSEKPVFSLYYASLRDGSARPVASPTALGEGLRVSETANVSFTRSGTAVLFGVARTPIDTLVTDSLDGKSVFDLWHYKDPTLQPTQKLNAARDRNRSFRAIYQISTNRVVRLANDSIPQVMVSSDGRIAVANSDERYALARLWGEDGNDVYLIDALTGAVRMVRENISGQGRLSPEGRYITFYHDGRWYSYTVATGRTVEITAPIKGVSFAREIHDRPSPAPAWGLASWTRGDRSVLVYDRYDVWELDPAGVRAPVMVTDSLGRRSHISLRLAIGGIGGGGGGFGGFGGGAETDDERAIDPAKPLLLSAFDEESKASGFYRDQLGVNRPPERIAMADAAHGTVIKAANAEQYLLTRGTFVEFPNLYTGTSLASLTRVSDANPQQKDYTWGTVELVKWVSTDGVPLQGLLFKPENFDSTKKYPMVTYFYEKLSQNRHNYVAPFGRNVINPTHYVSNGYLVFEPDIHYEEGYPGPSAMKSIIPGIQMLLARGYVDPKALGVNGQSWGGYQALYMITQTHIFRAAMTGAPVVNMTSAYGGIRWGSGLARPFMYEAGQSRIGGSIWEYPMRFIENSPLFWLDKVRTPLLIMHNDADDAVPWYQGIETFVALRRLGKEVYLINYNNDVHNPQSRANQKDIAMRMQQFFDHHLRGAPAPEWMKKGIPYLSKGRDQVPASTTPVQAGSQTPNP